MKLKHILAAGMIALSFPVVAAEGSLCLHVGFTDGTAGHFEVADDLSWHVEGNILAIESSSETSSYSYGVDGVADLRYIICNESSISDVKGIVTRLTSGGLFIEGAPAGSRCRVADAGGRVVAESIFDDSTTVSGLPSGIYIVTVNNREILKIVVK